MSSLSFGYDAFLIIELRVYKGLLCIYNSPSSNKLWGKIDIYVSISLGAVSPTFISLEG